MPRQPLTPHPASLAEQELMKSCRWTFGKSSGPGGQHRNKTQSAAVLEHLPTHTLGSASERRSQLENRTVALFRLRVNLALTQRGYFDRRDIPGTLLRTRLGAHGWFKVNPDHADFPAILAEVLDALDALKWDPADAANLIGCTTSQLVKFLRDEPRALKMINDEREQRGKHMLK